MTCIKICGITNLADAIASIEAGADLLGFNFYPPSPRSISPTDCAAITSVVKKEFPSVILVGVFVNMPTERLSVILEDCSLTYAQLHGDELPVALDAFPGRAYKAFRGIPERAVLNEFIRRTAQVVPAFLLDASVRGKYGGTGEMADWEKAAKLAGQHAMILAGGLTPDNVAEAVIQVRPWGVDTASGVEALPGKKDPGKIKAFVEAVRAMNPK